MKAYHYIVKGRVQGVGFRFFTRHNASRFNIKGWVRNLPNGNVEIFAQGNQKNLQEFEKIIKQGPRTAMVEDIDKEEKNYDDSIKSFSVRY